MLAAEIIAFSDLFDEPYFVCATPEQSLGHSIPLHLLTDSKYLFDIISKGSRPSEKRLMLDVHAAREAYQTKVISNIGFVRSDDNLADCPTKAFKQVALLHVLQTSELKISV